MTFITYKFVKGHSLFDILAEVKYSMRTIVKYIKLVQKKVKVV